MIHVGLSGQAPCPARPEHMTSQIAIIANQLLNDDRQHQWPRAPVEGLILEETTASSAIARSSLSIIVWPSLG